MADQASLQYANQLAFVSQYLLNSRCFKHSLILTTIWQDEALLFPIYTNRKQRIRQVLVCWPKFNNHEVRVFITLVFASCKAAYTTFHTICIPMVDRLQTIFYIMFGYGYKQHLTAMSFSLRDYVPLLLGCFSAAAWHKRDTQKECILNEGIERGLLGKGATRGMCG